MIEFQNNSHINYNEESDLFNFKNKADLIEKLVKNDIDYFKKNNLISLYGEWGSGKSSVLTTIKENLKKDNIKTVWFNTWEYEKDDNLSLSLLHCLIDQLGLKSTIGDSFDNYIMPFFKGFSKGVSLNFGIGSFSLEKIFAEYENQDKKLLSEYSYYEKQEEFKEKFKKIIDDLDRCDMENMLNLLSAIKLFFTLSDKLIFIVGIDKSAIVKALEYKYSDIVKAEEYLEKIFSFTFSMPKIYGLKDYLKSNFGDIESIEIIETFLKKIEFTNIRHLKKLFNKYSHLVRIKKIEYLPNETGESNLLNFPRLIPNIIVKKNDEQSNYKLLNTIFTLYFIILYDFHFEEYKNLKNYDDRLIWNGEKIYTIKRTETEKEYNYRNKKIKNYTDIKIHEILKIDYPERISLFINYLKEEISSKPNIHIRDKVPNDNILNKFYYFIRENIELFTKQKLKSGISTNIYIKDEEYPYTKLFEMVETLL